MRIDLDGPTGRKSWCLLAKGGDGPFVPILPAVALVRKLARGELAASGAMPCLGLLRLYEIEQEWQRAGLRIGAGWGEDGASLRPSLYRRVLGRDFEQLAVECQALHDAGTSTWEGRCRVDGAASLPARLVSWLFQLPPAIPDADIIVEFTVRDGQEVWTRHVGRRSMRSRQYIGTRKPRGSIVECFGPFAFDLALRIAEGRLWLVPTGARFTFDVEIGLPLIGRRPNRRYRLRATRS